MLHVGNKLGCIGFTSSHWRRSCQKIVFIRSNSFISNSCPLTISEQNNIGSVARIPILKNVSCGVIHTMGQCLSADDDLKSDQQFSFEAHAIKRTHLLGEFQTLHQRDVLLGARIRWDGYFGFNCAVHFRQIVFALHNVNTLVSCKDFKWHGFGTLLT